MNTKICDKCGNEIHGRGEFKEPSDVMMFVRDITGLTVKINKDLCDDCMILWKKHMELFFDDLKAKEV